MSDASSSEDEQDETKANDLSDPEIVTKYRLAGDIASKALAKVLSLATPGATPLALCEAGDTMIVEACSLLYSKKKKMEKGVAFPTCVSVNNCVGHFSPLTGEDGPPLAPGDVVKVDLGVQIDAYATQVAHTVIVPTADGAPPPVDPKVADVMHAAHDASELAHRMFKLGAKGSEITSMVEKVAASYGVSAMQGVLSHQNKKHVIDGNRCIANKTTIEHKVDEVTFEASDVFTLDFVMSSGEGKPIEQAARTTVFKRAIDQTYHLKMKTSRAFFSEVNRRFSTFPFSLRALSDEKVAKMGVVECSNHELMSSYPVLFEKAGEQVAHFKFSAMLLPSSTIRTTEGPPIPDWIKSEKSVEDEALKALLATEIVKKKKKSKKKGGAGGGGGAEDGDEAKGE